VTLKDFDLLWPKLHEQAGLQELQCEISTAE
jgi:hypothetical protein